MESPYLYRGAVTYVKEGNLYDMVIDLGFFTTMRVPVRLQGVLLPPLSTQTSAKERALAQAAKDVAMQVLLNRWVLVATRKESGHPSVWAADIFLNAVGPEEVMREVYGFKVVDFSAMMASLRKDDFDLRKVDLSYASGTGRSRKTFQKSGPLHRQGVSAVSG